MPTFGRLQICELNNFFVAAHNKDNSQYGFYLATGTLGIASFLVPMQFNSYLGTSASQLALGGTASIFIFDMYYKCTASVSTSYVALVFAISSKIIFQMINSID